MADTGVVIVTYNSAAVIGSCLDSCLTAGVSDIVVVDNASRDATLSEVRLRPGVRLLANSVNAGFAAAVNQGVAALQSSLILILNPDTRLLTGLGPLAEAARAHGASCGLLVDREGRPQRGFTFRRLPPPAALAFEVLGINRVWPGNPVNRLYRCLDADLSREQDVEQPAGAFLMVRRDAWQAVSGMDEWFHPVWFEDVDFCKRLAGAGYRIRFIPSVTAAHVGAHAVGRIRWEHRQVHWYASLLKYAAKHFGRDTSRLLGLAVMLGAFPRMLTGIPREGSLASLAAGAKVVRLAGRFLVRGGLSFDTHGVVWEPTPQLVKSSSSSGS